MTAYLTLFAWSFLASTILPLASEPMLIALVRINGEIAAPVLVATAGNFLGACTTYALARLAVARLRGRRSPGDGGQPRSRSTARHARARRMLEHWGPPALLLSWVPLIGDVIVVVAGGVGIRWVPFSAWTLAGKLARYGVVGWLAARM